MKLGSFFQKYRIEIFLWAAITLFVVYFSFAAINRLYTFRANYFDLGIMDQVVYNTSRGHFLEMTNPQSQVNTSRFAIHFDPLLALFAPLYWLRPDPRTLLIIQAIVVGLGAYAVYLIGNKLIKNKLTSLLFALSYLVYFPNQRAVIFDFHSVVFATTFLLFMMYFSLVKRYWLMVGCMFLALLTKEHVGLVTFLYGLYLFFIKKERTYSLIVASISMFFFVTTVMYIIPTARQGAHFALQYFDEVGESPRDIFMNLLTNPSIIAEKASSEDGFSYLRRLFTPHFMLAAFAPFELLIALPEILINLLSSSGNMRAIYFHYNAIIVPFIFLSVIVGYTRVTRMVKDHRTPVIVMGIYLILQLVSAYRYGPYPFKFFPSDHMPRPVDQAKVDLIEQWQLSLLPEAVVATSPSIAPFFTHRRYYYNFLYDSGYRGAGITEDDIIKDVGVYRKAEYVVLAKSEVEGENPLVKVFYDDLKENADYMIIFEEGDIIVYKR